MHPINGYLLGQLNFKANDLVEISNIINQINGFLNRLEIESLPINDIDEVLAKTSIENLKQIPSLRNLMIDLSLIHPKVELSTEYKQLKELIENKVPSLINQTNQIMQKIESDCRKLFSKAAEDFERKAVNLSYNSNTIEKNNQQKKWESYISYSDFKPLLGKIFGEHNSVAHFFKLDSNPDEVKNMFNQLKQQVMSQKSNLADLITQFGSEIPIDQIKEQDPIAYEFLRTIAFQEVARTYFNLEVREDKTIEQRIVRPADALASTLKISPVQIAIFALSLDPIRSFGLTKGQVMESKLNHTLNFIVLNDQEQRVIKQKIKVQISEIQSVYVIASVYVSYVKAELDKKFQSSSIRYA